jgi:hypothetical protein
MLAIRLFDLGVGWSMRARITRRSGGPRRAYRAGVRHERGIEADQTPRARIPRSSAITNGESVPAITPDRMTWS